MTATTSNPLPATGAAGSATGSRRRLYLARSAFAIFWAGLFAATSSPYGAVALVLVLLYPAVDIAAAVVDLRSSRTNALLANIGVSAVAVAALATVGTGDLGDVLRVWGAWAIAAGAIQLVVALLRKGEPGQVAMMLSGGLSVLAGASFVVSANDATSVGSIAGYAALGGVFFLVSALRIGRRSAA